MLPKLVLSQRTECLDSVSTILRRASGPGQIITCRDLFTPAVHAELLAAGGWLVLDLASPAYHAELSAFVGNWRREVPRTEMIYLAPFTHYREAPVLAACMARAPGHVLDNREMLRVETWQTLMNGNVLTRLMPALWEDLRGAMHVAGKSFKTQDKERQASGALQVAPYIRLVEDIPAEWHDGGYRCGRGLLYGSRLLWYSKLREQGYEPWYVAQALHYESSSIAGRSMREIWNVGLRELSRSPYAALAQAYADWLTTPGSLLTGRVRFRDLRGRVQKVAAPYLEPSNSSRPSSSPSS